MSSLLIKMSLTKLKGQLKITKTMKRKILQCSCGKSQDGMKHVNGLLDYIKEHDDGKQIDVKSSSVKRKRIVSNEKTKELLILVKV